jgi:hypothetical protein
LVPEIILQAISGQCTVTSYYVGYLLDDTQHKT